jgi:soluble lytic murein transglycosylase-like protein
LVRSLVVAGKPTVPRKAGENETAPRTANSFAGAPAGFEQAVDRIASLQGLPPELLHSVIQVESNYNPYAVSPKGALGIMQLIPGTARRFGVADVFDPVQNVEGGARYLKYLLELFDGNYPLALAAYNAGENAVAKYGTIPPYPETQTYLKLVAKHLEKAQEISAAKARERQEAKPAQLKADGNHVREVSGPDGTVRYVSQ